MASPKRTVLAFDLYGTLLSTESIAEKLAEYFGLEKAQSIAGLWRRYQLEYTWRLNSMGIYSRLESCMTMFDGTRLMLTHGSRTV